VVGFPRGITPESLDDFFLGGGKLDLRACKRITCNIRQST
jgi:hypothetical protein